MDHTKILATQIYASISSNKIENNISCRDDYLLYSQCKSPVLFNSKNKQVLQLQHQDGHSDQVNGQCFVTEQEAERSETSKSFHIISTAHDNCAIIWTVDSNNDQLNPSIEYKFPSPDESLFQTRCSHKIAANVFLSVTTTLNNNVYLWTNDCLAHTFSTNYCCFDAKLFSLKYKNDQKYLLLFLAASDNKVHIFKVSTLSDQININLDQKVQLEPILELGNYNDWVKCVDLIELNGRPNEFILATACQDTFIRVWHLKLVSTQTKSKNLRTIISDKSLCINGSLKLSATLETVLPGHGGVVHGLCWFRKPAVEDFLQLASCSGDKTIIIWRSTIAAPQKETASAGVWEKAEQVGETGEVNLPFLSICLSADEKTLYGHSLRGAIHSWAVADTMKCIASESITGHYDCVTDLAWENSLNGAYLISVSLDKTARIHSVYARDKKWHEICRPQVHGHEINCVASLNFLTFASGADEKTIRVFESTKFALKNFKYLTSIDDVPSEVASRIDELPNHAQLPSLGLSNRGAQQIYDLDCESDKPNRGGEIMAWHEVSELIKHLAQRDHLSELPYEEILIQSTLWWEVSKLFGHGNELYALASDSTGTFLASASKANRRTDLAHIIVWETQKYRKVATIEHHTLTVTRLKFSPNDQYLLSVSRDRTWCLCEKSSGTLRNAYKKIGGSSAKINAVHERIIWDCCWTHDSAYFMTVSRDKQALLWSVKDVKAHFHDDSANLKCVTSLQLDHSIQSVDSPHDYNATRQICGEQIYLFAFGLENGTLELCVIKSGDSVWQKLASFKFLHQLPIRRLAFKPPAHEADNANEKIEAPHLLLASCGDDYIVKLTRLECSPY